MSRWISPPRYRGVRKSDPIRLARKRASRQLTQHATVVFLADLTVALVAASVLGALARAVRVTPILGYVAAGMLIGPLTPGYATTGDSLGGLSELGLILLLFSLGLGFSLRELRAVGLVPMIGNFVLMTIFGAVAWGLGVAFGLVHPLTLALAFTLSSTAIGVALLALFGLLDTRPGHSAVALLVAQDLAAIVLLVITTTPAQTLTPLGVAVPLLNAIVFVVVALVLGATVLHRIVIAFLRRAPSDALIAFSTAVALVAAWIGHLAGLSFEFGAFVAGAVTSEAAGSRMVQSIVAPFRELFVMLFFVSIGTAMNVRVLLAHWTIIAAMAIALSVLRFAGWYGLSRLVRQPAGTAAALGVALLPLGEFNIVLANDSFLAKRLNESELGTAIGATLLSILFAAVAARVFAPRRQAWDASAGASIRPFESEPAVVILGYGRVGRTAAGVCRRAQIPFAVIELDVDLVHLAQRDGGDAQYGDGADPRVVERALAPATRVVLTTIPDTAANAALARRLQHQGRVRVIGRASRLRDIRTLLDAGAAEALVPEAEGAFGFAEALLAELGVSAQRRAELIGAQRAEIAGGVIVPDV
ncbi:MAG: cation:proton antiporter [Candidatus Eremiobacteraeota bacterium]|nr:cation:proton antiporter [Candidatus Eremiobacteraeota bacterium]